MASTRRPNQSVRITKTVVDKVRSPANGQTFIRDTELKGFGVRITAAGAKSFIIEKRVNGQVRRSTLAKYGELTVEQARKHARQELGKIALGIDPIAERRHAKIRGTTLAEAYRDFLAARKNLKPITLREYNRLFNKVFHDWQAKPLSGITKAMVAKRHREFGSQHGEASANLAMRFLRSVLNFAKATYDDHHGRSLIVENPVNVLSQTRAWYRNERRQTLIKPHQLPTWYAAVAALKTPLLEAYPSLQDIPPDTSADTVADYLLLLLFTGLRRQEAAQLCWKNVDLLHQTLVIPDTKNNTPLILPLSDFLLDLLTRRNQQTPGPYVFPGKWNRGYLIEPKRQMQKVIEQCGVSFTIHDLRRTFITLAESLDIPAYTIKRLVNHKMKDDVTAGYIITDVERLRVPMQKITSFLVTAMQAEPGAKGIEPKPPTAYTSNT